jgi:hypothetical protein
LKRDGVQECNTFSWLMNSDAWHQAHIGDLDAAMQSHQASWQAARVMEEELIINAHTSRIGWELFTLISLERTLAQGQPSAEALTRMQKVLADTDPVAAFRAGVEGQRAHIDRTCRALASGEITLVRVSKSIQPLTQAYWRATLEEARAAMLKALTEMLEAMELPAPQRQTRWREIAEEMRGAPGIASFYRCWEFGAWHIRGKAKRQCALAALAAERFRRETNRWPKSLDELTPKFLAELPLDPCTDQPLGYRSTRDGVVIFSVGPEGKYDGAYRDRPQPGENAAFEFRLWNVAKRRQVPTARP